jgi:hypothetical protein
MSLNKKSLLIMVALTMPTILFADPILISEWNWTDAGGVVHEYGAYNYADHVWDDAALQVVSGWHLATITSNEEQDALMLGLNDLQGEYWVGAYQSKKTRNAKSGWSWVTDEKWEYKNWAPGEANDAYGKNSEQYLTVSSNYKEHEWLWNDEGYIPNISGYIVERSQSVPEPGTVALCAISFLSLIALSGKKRIYR